MRLSLSFVIWTVVGILFFVIAVYAFCTKKPIGFWANAEAPRVTDVKKYNKAVGKLFGANGIVFAEPCFRKLMRVDFLKRRTRMHTDEKRKERNYEEDLKRIQSLRPMDDDFMRCIFKDNLPLSQKVLIIMLKHLKGATHAT